jgi:Flp pilus assembly protein TadG
VSAGIRRFSPGQHREQRGERGQALVEIALVLPLLLFLAFGVLGIARIAQARMEVSAVAREMARAGAMAGTPGDALDAALSRGEAVAVADGLTNGTLERSVDLGRFAPGGEVQAVATYEVSLADLPLLRGVRVRVASHHLERIDLYRSRPSAWGER